MFACVCRCCSSPRLLTRVALRVGALRVSQRVCSPALLSHPFVRQLAPSRHGGHLRSGFPAPPSVFPCSVFPPLPPFHLPATPLPVSNSLGAMSSPIAHPLVPSRRRLEEVVVLDSPPSPPPPAVLAAKRRRGGGSAESDGYSALGDSSPDVVVVGERRCGARGGGGGGGIARACGRCWVDGGPRLAAAVALCVARDGPRLRSSGGGRRCPTRSVTVHLAATASGSRRRRWVVCGSRCQCC